MSRISPGKASPPEDVSLRESLLYDLEGLQKDESTCDVEFVIGHERVKAHRLIVVSRCERYKVKRGSWLLGERDRGIISIQLSKHHNVAAVRAVIKYLYTGKISLHCLNPFRILLLCPELGLPALQTHTIHHIKSTLNADTVCQVLLAANTVLKDCKGEMVNPALQEIVQGCLDYIGIHTALVFAGEGFLGLHKSMLTTIISNNKLSITQDDVWRAVLRWGQHATGVDGGPGAWREGERIKMEETLDGLVEHVRVMEISDDVFTNEVEPTGLLSVEAALAKYRQGSSENGVSEPFAESAILSGRGDVQALIAEWCECGESEWRLLYRGSRDGFTARDFHSHCDDQGPTLTLIRSTSGCVFGGYTDANWNSRFKRGKFTASQSSCLFTIVNPSQTPPTRYLIKQPSYAINNHPSNGPIFGSGADLCISSDCNRNKESYSQLGHSYGDAIHPHLLTGEQYFTVGDIEVFCPA